MIITAIRTLISHAFDAASCLINPVADEVWERACRHADELAEAEAQEEVTAPSDRVEFLGPYETPEFFPSRSGGQTFETGPRPRLSVPPFPAALDGAGHLNVAKLQRVAADGIRQWTDGDRCTALAYWRSIAVQLDAAAMHAEIEDLSK